MNANNRFSEQEPSPDRGVDGLLDELGRHGAGDDIAFLGELEQRLDNADQMKVELQQEKRLRWSILAKVAALVVISGIATFVLLDRVGLPQMDAGAFLSDPDPALDKIVEQAGGSTPVGSLWEEPVPDVTIASADSAGDVFGNVDSNSTLIAAATPETRRAGQSGKKLATEAKSQTMPTLARTEIDGLTDDLAEFDAIATGAIATGAIATGAIATGAIATGAIATGAVAEDGGRDNGRIVYDDAFAIELEKSLKPSNASLASVVKRPRVSPELKSRAEFASGGKGAERVNLSYAGKRADRTLGPLPGGNESTTKEARFADVISSGDAKQLELVDGLGASDEWLDRAGAARVGGREVAAYKGSIRPVSLAKRASSTQSRVRYPTLIDNVFQSPRKEPLSTFSIDVDTAAYSNVRRMIQSGESVPPDAVRIEELINYFDYSYMDPGQELPFSVNLEGADCPWRPEHRLVRIGLKGQEIAAEKRQALNLVFLVDVSGSMNQERKLPLVQRSLHLLIDALREDDMITIVTYAGHEGVALAPTRGSNKAVMHSAVDRLRSSGGTNGEAGIKLAYKLASDNFSDGGVNRILLATDGDFNIGVSSTEALRDMVQREAKRGVFLSVLGFGSDNLNDAMLETITNDGNGTYHYIDSVSEGRKVLVEDLTSTMITIAKDVKIQVEFNPATVGAYRLIGYANRKLPPEAFNDDRIDAGDIGAGHTVTAFYEIIPPGLEGKVVDNLKYQVPSPAPPVPETEGLNVTDSSELLTVKLRYKAPQGSESKLIEVPFTDNANAFSSASADFRFAASVAAFGLQLRQSPHRGNLTRNQVIAIADGALGTDPQRKEFVQLVANAIVKNESK